MKLRGIAITVAVILAFINCPYSMGQNNEPARVSQTQQDFSSYMEDVNAKLRANWLPPDFLESAHIKVSFKLDKNGYILSGRIVESSGNDLYDSSAIRAVAKSEPFGKFPENSSKETITINYNFDTSMVKTDRMQYYYDLARKYTNAEPDEALKYINLAISEVNGDENSYFLYYRRAKIKERIGDYSGANADKDVYNNLKAKVDLKRVHAIKHLAEVENDAFSYYYLSYAYEQMGDYENAISAIDKAIARTDLNNQYKRYKAELIAKKLQ